MRMRFHDGPNMMAAKAPNVSTALDQARMMRDAVRGMNDRNKRFWARDEDSRELVFTSDPGSVYVAETGADGSFQVFRVSPQRAGVEAATTDRHMNPGSINKRNADFWKGRGA